MVKITNGKNVFEVTRGAFDCIYSRQGYEVVKEEGVSQIPGALGKTEDEKFLEEIVEKPISQWNKEEVKRYAELNDIDLSGVKNANEAKERIKDFLDQE